VILANAPAAEATASDSVNPGDQLNVTVYNHPDLCVHVQVDSRGGISLPVAGYFEVAGMSLRAIDDQVAARLAPYIKYPAVDIQSVGETQAIFIAGGPGGVLQFSAGETLTTALADLEKLMVQRDPQENNRLVVTDQIDHSRLDLHRVGLYRGGKPIGTYDTIAMRQTGDPGPLLRANDTIAFRNKPIPVTVSGFVAKPGRAFLDPAEPLSDAVEQVGGTLPSAATSHIELTAGDGAPQIVSLGSPIFAQPAVADESLYIPVAPRVQVNGLVARPGQVALGTDFTLLGAINSAGGINKFANIKDVQVTQDGKRTSYDITRLTFGDMSQNPTLKDGDSVFLPEGHKVDFSAVFYSLSTLGGIASLRGL
jgi:polysaccharide export outer membrane protein